MRLCGLLNLNKPVGLTSRQVVDVVQQLVRPAKAGHAGTLDPLASGVLILCIGGATHLIQYVQRMRKRYVGTFLLGHSSPTEDIEGDVTLLPNPKIPTGEQIEAATRLFLGRIEQRPPIYSALKIRGRPAYKLAREGKTVDLAPRQVEVFNIEVQEYQYPKLVLAIECSAGTYVRSLGRDLAESLGTTAVMSGLTRTAIGEFRIEDALDPRELRAENLPSLLLPPLRAVESLPHVRLSANQTDRIRHGQTIEGFSDWPQSADEIAAINPSGDLIGILSPAGDTSSPKSLWRPLRNLPI